MCTGSGRSPLLATRPLAALQAPSVLPVGARSYSIPTIKRLWALSGNQCYMPECKVPLAFVEAEHVMGDIAHIRAASPKGCRFDPAMTDVERAAFENLLLMCPTHHRLVDKVSCDQWSADELRKMKAAHEAANHPTSLPDELLGWAARGSLHLLEVAEANELGHEPLDEQTLPSTMSPGITASGGVPGQQVPKVRPVPSDTGAGWSVPAHEQSEGFILDSSVVSRDRLGPDPDPDGEPRVPGPRFGQARFGQSRFGVNDPGSEVPGMPSPEEEAEHAALAAADEEDRLGDELSSKRSRPDG